MGNLSTLHKITPSLPVYLHTRAMPKKLLFNTANPLGDLQKCMYLPQGLPTVVTDNCTL